uniref:Secreted protein n=1 Tax=Arundo donax TaxID=35708 RepID=A0A0A8Z0Y1_ARUDO
MHITLSLGACMDSVMMLMLCGMIPLTLTLCSRGTGTASCRHYGCTRVCSILASDRCVQLQRSAPALHLLMLKFRLQISLETETFAIPINRE